jgi:Icc-related predicted phosphoesterase
VPGEHVNRILCAADPGGSVDMIEGLLVASDQHNVDAVAMIGDLGERGDGYRSVFHALGRASCPVFWVPGPSDAPVERHLQEAFNMETAYPLLRGVHGTAANASGELLFAGFGGEISDDPQHRREEREKLSYPRWEPEYRLKILGEFDYNDLVLLFWTAPLHKGLGTAGSEAVAELIGTYRPRLAVCGEGCGAEVLGRTAVVAPGSLRAGYYAIADLRERKAQLRQLVPSTASHTA